MFFWLNQNSSKFKNSSLYDWIVYYLLIYLILRCWEIRNFLKTTRHHRCIVKLGNPLCTKYFSYMGCRLLHYEKAFDIKTINGCTQKFMYMGIETLNRRWWRKYAYRQETLESRKSRLKKADEFWKTGWPRMTGN